LSFDYLNVWEVRVGYQDADVFEPSHLRQHPVLKGADQDIVRLDRRVQRAARVRNRRRGRSRQPIPAAECNHDDALTDIWPAFSAPARAEQSSHPVQV